MLTDSFPDPVLYDDWHVVACADDLKENQLLKVHLLGEAVVLWRCDRQVLAWRDRCPHRGVPLSSGRIENGCVVCPYHGFVFDRTGNCIHVPANPALTSVAQNSQVYNYAVQERYGYIWIALGEPQHQVPIFWEWHQPDFVSFNCGPYVINSSPLRVVENFTDFAHLPHTHAGLLGSSEFPEISDYAVTVDEAGITASDVRLHQPNPEGTGAARDVSYLCQIRRPLVAYFTKGDGTDQFSMFLAVTPVEELRSIAWLGIARNYALEVDNAELEAFQNHLMSQDIPMVESQRPQRLPLDLQAEFHVPADRLAVAYRKWLKQLGLQFGAC
ncbi:MAG: aromatic ring-hydroxylating dioxygenase subunit alpha [Leptolyngbyaceae cyanobacterium SL_7_1]|nr:aromatic ring-hydroxylating dioxygenase subunit alpha [Leptolyngbyaceae cyanobacterium SL_7_1]